MKIETPARAVLRPSGLLLKKYLFTKSTVMSLSSKYALAQVLVTQCNYYIVILLNPEPQFRLVADMKFMKEGSEGNLLFENAFLCT